MVSCIFLILAAPNDELARTEGLVAVEIVETANTVFTVIFTLEFISKIMTHVSSCVCVCMCVFVL